MRKILIALIAIPLISATLIFSIYESLKITESDAKVCLLLSIGNGLLDAGNHNDIVSIARSLSTEEKIEGTRQLMKLAKEYMSSEEFKSDYKKWRNNKLNPDTKTKIGLPKFGKMLENKIDNKVDKSENEKRYPSDPNELVKKRLTDFLAISATVDFDAKLTESRGFENPAYQKKSSEWKMCYRAGREVVQVAREEAQKWLDELNAK